jgi:hypothetical protein
MQHCMARPETSKAQMSASTLDNNFAEVSMCFNK